MRNLLPVEQYLIKRLHLRFDFEHAADYIIDETRRKLILYAIKTRDVEFRFNDIQNQFSTSLINDPISG